MDDYSPTTEEYDVFIEDDLKNDLEPCHEYDARVLSAQLLPPLYSVVFLAGLLDNALVVLILGKYKGLKHVENIYFLNLAIGNLVFLLILPFWAHGASRGGLLGQPLCQVLVGFYSVGFYSEAIFNVLLALCLLLHERRLLPAAGTARCGATTSALVWMAVAVVTVTELTSHKPQVGGPRDECILNRPHFLPTNGTFLEYFLTLKMNILGLLFPLFVLVFCSVLARRTLRSRERSHDLVKLIFAIMIVFLLMWAPYNIALFLGTFREYFSLHDCKSSYNLDQSIHITKIFAATHCCVSPLLYVFLDKTFRKHLCCSFHLCNTAPLQPHEISRRDMFGEQHDQSTEV
ncbi:C-C chemokine receptor-like 2 [Tamandua tetradactyla]|uniref:C-C chemokine receptor-like 2 n=1 Tax=Tamandua tetradactyla TaxID=48850 RepID=UPI004053B453